MKQKFANILKEILAADSYVREPISRRPKTGDQITAEMDRIRALPLRERRELYRKQRVDEQRGWYVGKVMTNRRHFARWIVFCVAVQGG